MSRFRSLGYYILTRLLFAPVMLWLITSLVFLLLRATPGDPVDALLGPRAPQAAKDALRSQLGLDKPLFIQYLNYWNQLGHLDESGHLNLGTSLTAKKSVWDIISQFFPATLELALFSMAIALIVGIAVGILSASKPNSSLDAGDASLAF